MSTRFTLNEHAVALDGAPDMPLLWALRDLAGLTGTKYGCGLALCGACTVHLDGQAVRSCQTPLFSVEGRQVVTIEAIGRTPVGRRVQAAWVAQDVPQCGYCQSGQIMSAVALLQREPRPSVAQIHEAMDGNICRCGTYERIQAAIVEAAGSAS
ncbi:MAG: 2Fe-2S iron-sulfur cluster binding domain-containing protein [Hydrogenophaga sp.]|uniref:(2Fe-2S)-binding protein n=1 Tax=Hydrogenophaga sp. TaxID=1904254 RepID=UPI0016B4E160|nr:(2Fe-2S)-binding protein [Hydrogenophaga sp.]NIM41450.1 2Fe-2S iron-sulfur cluster binding domain-containing protein [Hydrogenophaga sp.]NIN26766.1 2Fe-2S iron-sulfur cluster binding domain-containing protein [Hydrogenophaga sp.]NIN31465.1 2Fe-2S iron-sulfur cluster binding domain-containing protein [Hydrogenophaga sp.]NIN55696.1 2Fe-2S iron-sulfur cluster binding domain-containing protein [Hydrogenophaga sp.]NIO51859.1 2Fe-2S iron-sulfur cluster binding domain-containing protein [Hydrogeno